MKQENKNEVKRSRLHLATRGYIRNIELLAEETDMIFTEGEKSRIMNAIRTIDPILVAEGMNWNELTQNNVETVLRQVAYLKVNPSAMPRECYFILRGVRQKDNTYKKVLEFGIEGAGNDAILRNFGVDVKEVKSYIVYEGDEFEAPYFDGWETKLPKYQPKYKSKKALFAVYLIKLNNGEIQVSITEREEAKQSLLAHIRQNGVDENKLRELEKHSLDDLLTKPEFVNAKIKTQYGKERDMIGLAWTSAVSKEAMIERKLRNLATRKFPKDFTHKDIELLYEETFEEQYKDGKAVNVDEIVEEIEGDFEDNANVEEIPQEELNVSDDFEVVEETGEVVEPTVAVETQETLTAEQKLQEDFKKHLAEKEKQEKEQKDLFDTQEQEKPDWL